jgi:hypothetical protein
MYKAAAAQLAIWSVEYNVTPSISNSTELADFNGLLAATLNAVGPGPKALIPENGWPNNTGASQQMLIASPVPEASTWAMMVLGFAGVGFMAYRRRNQSPSLRTA